jgi:hypothetical protein
MVQFVGIVGELLQAKAGLNRVGSDLEAMRREVVRRKKSS